MNKIFLSLILICIFSLKLISQTSCRDNNQFADPSQWTKVGSSVYISDQSVVYDNNVGGQSVNENRVWKVASTYDTWRSEFDFVYTSDNIFGPSVLLFNYTTLSIDPWFTGGSVNANVTITVLLQSDGLSIFTKIGSNGVKSRAIPTNYQTNYYVRFERKNYNKVLLSVYSDAGRTNLIDSVQLLIGCNFPRDMKFIQVSGGTGSGRVRNMSGTVSNLTFCPIANDSVPETPVFESFTSSSCTNKLLDFKVIGDSAYQWKVNNNNVDNNYKSTLQVKFTNPGLYNIAVYKISNCGNSTEAQKDILISNKPTLDSLRIRDSLFLGEKVVLNQTKVSGIWDSSNPDVATITQQGLVTVLSKGETIISYTLDSAGCINKVSKKFIITDKKDFPIVIYELVTRNGDGKNDFFNILNIDKYPNHQLNIFDKYGKVVYSSNSYGNDWNGDGLPNGTYFYRLKIPELEESIGNLFITN